MKFDVNVFRYIEKDAWRVLVSVEMGMKNHELVPAQLVESARRGRGPVARFCQGGFRGVQRAMGHFKERFHEGI